jgi:hypothetical protein
MKVKKEETKKEKEKEKKETKKKNSDGADAAPQGEEGQAEAAEAQQDKVVHDGHNDLNPPEPLEGETVEGAQGLDPHVHAEAEAEAEAEAATEQQQAEGQEAGWEDAGDAAEAGPEAEELGDQVPTDEQMLPDSDAASAVPEDPLPAPTAAAAALVGATTPRIQKSSGSSKRPREEDGQSNPITTNTTHEHSPKRQRTVAPPVVDPGYIPPVVGLVPAPALIDG